MIEEIYDWAEQVVSEDEAVEQDEFERSEVERLINEIW